jgi:hypothetical protein
MGAARVTPGIDLRREIADPARRQHHIVPPEVLDRPTVPTRPIPQPLPSLDGVVDAATKEDEAVPEPGGPVERLLARSTKPDRDRPRRLRHECSSINPVEPAGEVNDRFGEQPAKQFDLLLLPRAAATEVLAQGLVLHVAPADPHT